MLYNIAMNKKSVIIVIGLLGIAGSLGYAVGNGLDEVTTLSFLIGVFGVVSGFRLYG